MSKARFIFLNSMILVPVTAAVVSFAMELVWKLYSGSDSIPVYSLLSKFVIGLIIGTAVIILNLLAMRFKKRPAIGYVLSFSGGAGAYHRCIFTNRSHARHLDVGRKLADLFRHFRTVNHARCLFFPEERQSL